MRANPGSGKFEEMLLKTLRGAERPCPRRPLRRAVPFTRRREELGNLTAPVRRARFLLGALGNPVSVSGASGSEAIRFGHGFRVVCVGCSVTDSPAPDINNGSVKEIGVQLEFEDLFQVL